ncbi:MAG: YicC/YloC family endoribonuclease [Bacteroidota bacterium]
MIQSMTGYGKKIVQLPLKKITVELKSLNSKNLDINARMPSLYREKELELRALIANALTRGKVDVHLSVEITGEETLTQINKAIAKQYIEQLKTIVDGDETELLKMAIRMPDVLKTASDEVLDEAEYHTIKQALADAIEELTAYRRAEGAVLEKEFAHRVRNITQLAEKIEQRDTERLPKIRERLEKAVSELKENLDKNRFEQELIYYLEKYDITEEKVRLANHLDYFEASLNSKDSNGKKLGFICQEIGREINTIGSKANDAAMQQTVVEMKDELEKIKEQLLNVL